VSNRWGRIAWRARFFWLPGLAVALLVPIVAVAQFRKDVAVNEIAFSMPTSDATILAIVGALIAGLIFVPLLVWVGMEWIGLAKAELRLARREAVAPAASTRRRVRRKPGRR
jgi:hypothetical protein